VSVIDTATNTVVATVVVGNNPDAVAITPDGDFAYVANFGSNTVSVIDTATNTVAATVPVGLGPDAVAITPNGADAYVANLDSNNVSVIDTAATPGVTAVSPNQGPTAGGTSVTVTGTNFTGATTVNFGANPAAIVGSCTATSCTVTAPAGAAGTVDVTVTTPGGISAASAADHYTYIAPPAVTGVSPNAGPLTTGTSVTITGTNLTGATTVKFGTNPATIVGSCTATSCTVIAPAGTAGTVDVTVTTVGGTSAVVPADQYTYVAPPAVTGVSPNAGPLSGGNSVTIAGSALSNPTSVNFGTNPATIVGSCTATSCTVIAPAETAGTVDVTVTTVGGTSPISPADQYTYTPVPIVTGILPVGGSYLGGTTVTVTGTNLGPTTSIHFGVTNAPGFTCTATQCTVNSPPGVPGSVVDVTVTTPGGTSATSPADQFTYGGGIPAPSVRGISPNSGPSAGGTVVTITGQGFSGATGVDFGDPPATDVTCSDTVCTATSPPGTGTVAVTVVGPGGRSVLSPNDQFTYTGTGPTPPTPPVPPFSNGYWLVASDGGIFAFGGSPFFGSTGAQKLNKPIVGMASTPDAGGYWLVASDGGIFAFGDAGFFGSTGAIHLNQPLVGMAATPDGKGYWLVASDGGIFAFGDAGFFGSTGGMTLNQPIVGMVSTPDGKGYWMVASDGGIFAFGDASFFGSTGGMTLNKPIVGMASTPDGRGYWLVASDGGIFAFGDAGFFGSTGAIHLNKPVVGMSSTPDGRGYWLVASDGGIFSFGDAPFFGSTGGQTLNQPIMGMTTRF
jgi:YVTN family beta-propeller protein